MPRSPKVASISPTPQSQTPSRANPADLTDEVHQLQGEMNAASEWLLMTKATMDSHQRDLALNANIAGAKMRPGLPRPSKRQRSTAQLQSRRQKPAMQLQSTRQMPAW